MEFSEIVEQLEKQEISPQDLGHSDMENPLPEIGKWEQVAHYDGEGKGESWYSVVHFTEHDVYIRVDAWYSSYNGADFSESTFDHVVPTQKAITVYTSI